MELVEIRCKKCNRILFKIKLEKDAYIECKCSRCNEINKIQLVKP